MNVQFTLKSMLIVAAVTGALAGTSTFFASGTQAAEEQHAPQAAQVTVAEVISEKLTEWDEFTGRIQAPQMVELRPRVSGYIDFVMFEEGALVQAGDPLFLIDNHPFNVEVKRLEADLADSTSQAELAKRDYQRALDLHKQKAVSAELLDTRLARNQQTHAQVQSVKAALELAKLNRGYTHVTAPISGRVSNAMITKGNYVTAGQSILTTLVSTDEAYAYFDADEQTYLKYRQLARQGKRGGERENGIPVQMGLATDKGFPYQGVIDFVDNHVDKSTGTIRGRAVFKNTDGDLIPGLFARLRLIGSASYVGILIDDKAIGTDLNNKFVLVLDEQSNTVNYRPVELGETLNGLRIIRSGLQAGEKIVINGLQRVRPGSPVAPIKAEMASAEILKDLREQQARVDSMMDNNVQLAAVNTGN